MSIKKGSIVTIQNYNKPHVVMCALSPKTLEVCPICRGKMSDKRILVTENLLQEVQCFHAYVTKVQWERLTSTTPPNCMTRDYESWIPLHVFIQNNIIPPAIVRFAYRGEYRYVYVEGSNQSCTHPTAQNRWKQRLHINLFGIRLC